MFQDFLNLSFRNSQNLSRSTIPTTITFPNFFFFPKDVYHILKCCQNTNSLRLEIFQNVTYRTAGQMTKISQIYIFFKFRVLHTTLISRIGVSTSVYNKLFTDKMLGSHHFILKSRGKIHCDRGPTQITPQIATWVSL